MHATPTTRRNALALLCACALGVATPSVQGQPTAVPRHAGWRLDPASEKFERFGFAPEATGIRQNLGRPGVVRLPESGTEHISVIRTA